MGALFGAIVDALYVALAFIVRFGSKILPFIGSIAKILSNFWVYLVTLLPVVIDFLFDKFSENIYSWIADCFTYLTTKVTQIPDISFPTIPTLSDAYYALDPLIRNYLDLFRVPEATAIIATVVIWRSGLSLTSKFLGRF